MRPFALLLIVLVSESCWCQLASTSAAATPAKDPTAVALAQKSLVAMGRVTGGCVTDSQASGTLTLHLKEPGQSFPITLKSQGTTKSRSDFQGPSGIETRIVNGAAGSYRKSDGTTKPLNQSNSYFERVRYLPICSLLAENANPNVEITLLPSETVNGSPADVISLALVESADAKQAPIFRKLTQTKFFIDQQTGFVSKISYTVQSENGSSNSHAEIIYSDYRTVNGIAVPFSQTTYLDGKLLQELTLTSIAFNVGLSDSDFAVAAVN